MKNKVRLISLYLPQYHPTPNNDKWWGKGFTEWTNVGKAKPLFKGHYQPRVPADLGYYDLRLPEIRETQANMAREAGIEGFCYYHYWFGDGHEELDLPFKEVVKSGSPDFPFCLCWANESWHSKFWNIDGTVQKTLLAEQRYPGDKDIENHFLSLLSAFQDKRYIRVDGRLLFMIYMPLELPEAKHFITMWNELAISYGLGGFYFIGHLVHGDEVNEQNVEKIMDMGFDAVNVVELFRAKNVINSGWTLYKNIMMAKLLGRPLVIDHKQILPHLITKLEKRKDVILTITPNWDHTPRSGKGGFVLKNSTPEVFREHVKSILELTREKGSNDNLVILKAWNEWGEGNYVEPDLKYGRSFLNVLQEEVLK